MADLRTTVRFPLPKGEKEDEGQQGIPHPEFSLIGVAGAPVGFEVPRNEDADNFQPIARVERNLGEQALAHTQGRLICG